MTFLRRLAAVSAWGYLAGVTGYWIALRFVGESWWPTTIALYLPHALGLAPALPLLVLLALVGPRRFAPVPAVAALIVLFPIMGLVVFGGAATPSGTPRMRVLSYNIDSGRRSIDDLAAQISEANPDLVLLQEGDPDTGDRVTAGLVGFTRAGNGQFYVASRWPIVAIDQPPKISFRGADRSPRFMHYTLATPLGTIELFNVHPISPRDGFESIRGTGLVNELESGAVLQHDGRALVKNTELRRAQAHTIVRMARAARHPVIIAGDTNLPEGSGIFADTLGRYQDGFAAVGRGLGYTFPAHKRFAWMRIDRILAGPELRFLAFTVGSRRGSDHYCVWADLERRR